MLLKVLKDATLSVEEVPKMVQQLSSAKCGPDDLHELLNALQDCISVGEEEEDKPLPVERPSGGKLRQDFTSFVNFLTQNQWDSLLQCKDSDEDPLGECQGLLTKILGDMSLRDPSETTSRCVSIVMLCCAEGIASFSGAQGLL